MLADIASATGYSAAVIKDMERKGLFPRRLRSQVGRPRWHSAVVNEWVREKLDSKGGEIERLMMAGVDFTYSEISRHKVKAPKGLVFDGHGHTMKVTLASLDAGRILAMLRQCRNGPGCPECNG